MQELTKRDYETKLRMWYLARLRKSALDAELAYQSTPSTLVGADNEAIRRMLQEKDLAPDDLKQSGGDASRESKASVVIGATALLIATLVATVFALFV